MTESIYTVYPDVWASERHNPQVDGVLCRCGNLIRPGGPEDEHVYADGSFRAAPDWVHLGAVPTSWCDDTHRARPARPGELF